VSAEDGGREEASARGGDGSTSEESSRQETGSASTEERVRQALCDVIDPCSAATGSRLNVVEMGLVDGIEVERSEGDGAHVHVDLRLTSPMCHQVPYFYEEIEGRIGDLPGVASATLDTDLGLEWTEDDMTEAAKRKRQKVLDGYEARYREELADG
jgi:metal-sulfur cluster biosynthetic enzyme